MVGAGEKMGDLVFQSFEDLLTWAKVKLPQGRFGFVVDGHSFLEFFTLLTLNCLQLLNIMQRKLVTPPTMK